VAQQRNNPDFSPTRIFQPAASPVDIYFRPNLAQPELPKSAEIYKALAELSPKLNAIASDVSAFGIKQEQQAGAMEVATATNEADLQRKIAQAIEKSGGFAPWRAQATLEAAGERMVMDKYSKALYENLDALSEPTNPDGTMKNPEDVVKKKEELFNDVGLPQNSYYIQKAAIATKQSIDAQFDSRLISLRTQKLKQKNDNDLSDSMVGIWNTVQDPDQAMAQTAELLNQYYQKFGTSGYETAMNAFTKWAKGATAAGDYDTPTKLIAAMGSMASEKGPRIGDIELPARFSADIRMIAEDLEVARERFEEKNFANAQRRKAVVTDNARDAIGYFLTEQSKQGILPATEKDLYDAVHEIAKKHPGAQEGDLRLYARSVFNDLNSPKPSDKNTLLYLEPLSRSLPTEQFRSLAYAAVDVGSLHISDANRLLTQSASIDEAFGKSGQVSLKDSLVEAGLNSYLWAGVNLDDDTKVKLEKAGITEANNLSTAIAEKAKALKNEFVNNPTGYELALQQMTRAMVAESKARLLKENEAVIKAGTLDSEAAVLKFAGGPSGIDAFVAVAPGYMGIGKKENGEVDTNNPDYGDVYDQLRVSVIADLSKTYESTQGNVMEKEAAVRKRWDKLKGEVRSGIQKGDYFFLSQETQRKYIKTPEGIERARNVPVATQAGPAYAKAAQAYIDNPNTATEAEYSKQRAAAYGAAVNGITKITSPNSTMSVMSDKPNRMFGGAVVTPQYVTIPAYELREDGVYTASNAAGSYIRDGNVMRQFDERSTNEYKLGVSFRGLTEQEIQSGKTREGFTITDDMLDWGSNILFPDYAAFKQAATQYKNDGTGPIDTYIKKIEGKLPFDPNRFLEAQRMLFMARQPSSALPIPEPSQATLQNTTGTESSI
jgi:hypothetical protein